MIVDVSPMLRGEVDRIDIDYMLTHETPEGATFGGDAHVYGKLTDDAGYMRLSLEASLDYTGECARCLEAVTGTFTFSFERTVVSEGTLSEEKLEEDIDEYAVLVDGKLDVDEQIREALLLEFPHKLLCSEDCPGLCMRCGKPLRDGDCGCQKNEGDPRLAVLKKLLDKE